VATFQLPRVVIAGLRGGSGKTLVSAGLARALSNQGLRVAVFKKGPDFIDTEWLGAAARTEPHNLDTFLAESHEILRSLQTQCTSEIAIIEGNRGLFDGLDAQGTHSTAELAKLIQAPLVLVIDATKSTRTVAALVLGCLALDPELPLSGVILNRVGTPRQERLIREALSLVCDVPVLGAIPRLAEQHLPSRHLGLVLPAEREDAERALQALADAITAHVDLMSLRHLAARARALHVPSPERESTGTALRSDGSGSTTVLSRESGTTLRSDGSGSTTVLSRDSRTTHRSHEPGDNGTRSLGPVNGSTRAGSASRASARPSPGIPIPRASTPPLRVGVLRDAAFCFYYPENLAALEAAGACLVPVSPLADRDLPAIDALYAGGGYPEQFAQELAENSGFRNALAEQIRNGLPVWAECGGLMYLGQAIVRDTNRFPMVGALSFVAEHTARPQAHGYVEARVDRENPFLPVGTRLRGHEFHHSRLVEYQPGLRTALAVARGVGIGNGRDGVVMGCVFASYLHLFAPGAPEWAKSLVRTARKVQTAQAVTNSHTKRGEEYGKHCSWRSQHRSRRGWFHSGTGQVE